jgi:hypothetical protein
MKPEIINISLEFVARFWLSPEKKHQIEGHRRLAEGRLREEC